MPPKIAQKKKKNPPQVQNPPRQKSQSRGITTASMAPLFDYINPFSGVMGAKVFDESCQRSVSYRSRSTVIGTPTSNKLGYKFSPSLKAYSQFATFTGAAVTAWSAADEEVNDYTLLSGIGVNVRIVSWGVRVVNTGPPLTSSGTVYFKSFYKNIVNTSVSWTPTETTTLADETDVVPIQQLTGVDYVWIAKPVLANATMYTDAAFVGASTLNDGLGWNSLAIIATDLSDDVILSFETVYNLEIIPNSGTVAEAIATPANPYRPQILEKVSDVRSKLPAGFRSVGDARNPGFLGAALGLGSMVAKGALSIAQGQAQNNPLALGLLGLAKSGIAPGLAQGLSAIGMY